MARTIKPFPFFCLFVSLAFVWGSPQTHAQVVVSGPQPSAAHALEDWAGHHIPAGFQPRTRIAVTQMTDTQMNDYLRGSSSDDQNAFKSSSSSEADDESDIDGVFDNDPPRITLRILPSGETDLFTFSHEYGHYVWFSLFSESDRSRYETLYKKQAAKHHLVTRYAESNVEEGFAEAFSFYINEPSLLQRRDSLSAQFLARWVAPKTPTNE